MAWLASKSATRASLVLVSHLVDVRLKLAWIQAGPCGCASSKMFSFAPRETGSVDSARASTDALQASPSGGRDAVVEAERPAGTLTLSDEFTSVLNWQVE